MDMQERTRRLRLDHSVHTIRTNYAQVIHGVRQTGAEPVSVRDQYDALTMVYPQAVFTGWSAAGLHGVPYSEGHPPEIWLPEQRRRQGIVIRSGRLPDRDITRVLNRRATTAVRTAVDLARHEPGDRAIAAIDQCIHEDEFGRPATTLDEIGAYLEAHSGLHRGVRVRHALREASRGADSPWETYTRLVVHRSGLRLFEPQTPVIGTRYHVDLGAAEYQVAVEYDGKPHRDSKQHDKDAERLNEIIDADWAVVLVTAGQLMHKRTGLLEKIARRLTERGWRGPAPSTPPLHL
jgi:very-short-patch-repair endonuclease